MSHSRKARAAAGAALTLALVGALVTTASTASALPPGATYTVSAGSTGNYPYPTDTQAGTYIDKDGTFYSQQSAALYGASDPRFWEFYTGTNLDTATKSSTLSNFVNPANSNDRNNDTTWRCDNSPTGLAATNAPAGSGYAHRNYCDLAGVWVDPDTGNWHGLVHNEFTPEPFGDGLHFDAIDHTVSTDQGRTWTIDSHVITSPYSTQRGDTAAFPNQTYDYGDGDQRLLVDTASGYFYSFYGSRIVDKSGGWRAYYSHVARAPMSGKMASGTWQKWYNGSWSQPGVGGKESNMVPVTGSNPNGYTPASAEYSPMNTGTASQQIAAGKMPATSPMFVMNVTYNAYLGVYLGTPQAVDQSGNAPQEYYATDDLATQKWTRIGDSGSYHTASWYRWFLDGANKTSSTIVGKTFRSYCSIACAGSSGQYVNMTIDSNMPAPAPVDLSKTYTIGSGSGRVLAQSSGSSATISVGAATGSALEAWSFTSLTDGSYRITNASTGQALGVDGAVTTTRAWGAKPTVTAVNTGNVGQQWFIVKNSSGGTFRLVNRYSGLVLGMSADASRLAETTPTRDWTNTTGNSVGGNRTGAEQILTLTQSGSTGTETVGVTNPGAQTSTNGTAVSLQVTAVDSQNKPLTYSATGLPAGLSISSSGLITGTPTTNATSNVTVTASSGTASGQTSFSWTVNPVSSGNLNGTRTVIASGKALDDPGHSTTAGTQLITWSPSGGLNQKWVFTQQSDGSYRITNAESNLCVDVSGNSSSAGAQILQWTCGSGSNQRWIATPVTGGYTLTSQSSGLLLTTASTADGALITQQPNTGSALQRWAIS